jgi:hypothetical protein
MKVELDVPQSIAKPRRWVQHEQLLAMVLRPGSIDVGLRRAEMTRLTYDAGEMFLCHRHIEKWIRTDDLHYLSIALSDAALTAACDGTGGEVELPSVANLVDPRLRALASAVNAERIAGFPSGFYRFCRAGACRGAGQWLCGSATIAQNIPRWINTCASAKSYGVGAREG